MWNFSKMKSQGLLKLPNLILCEIWGFQSENLGMFYAFKCGNFSTKPHDELQNDQNCSFISRNQKLAKLISNRIWVIQSENCTQISLPRTVIRQTVLKILSNLISTVENLQFNIFFYHYSECSKNMCKSCHTFFPNGPASVDCSGECGLCDLCPFNPTVKECDTICKKGVAACTETCNKGKAICMNCKCWL